MSPSVGMSPPQTPPSQRRRRGVCAQGEASYQESGMPVETVVGPPPSYCWNVKSTLTL